MGFYACLGVEPSFDASHKFVTSPFLRSPLTLALVRVAIAFYTVLVLLVTLIWKAVKLDAGNECVIFLCSVSFFFLLTKPFWLKDSSPIFHTSLISDYVPITALQVLKQLLTRLDGGNQVQGLDTRFNAGQRCCRRSI